MIRDQIWVRKSSFCCSILSVVWLVSNVVVISFFFKPKLISFSIFVVPVTLTNYACKILVLTLNLFKTTIKSSCKNLYLYNFISGTVVDSFDKYVFVLYSNYSSLFISGTYSLLFHPSSFFRFCEITESWTLRWTFLVVSQHRKHSTSVKLIKIYFLSMNITTNVM